MNSWGKSQTVGHQSKFTNTYQALHGGQFVKVGYKQNKATPKVAMTPTSKPSRGDVVSKSNLKLIAKSK